MTARETRTAIVNGLIAKRAEIAGVIADLQKKIEEHQNDLTHLDHALRLFDPTISAWRDQEWVTSAEIADRAMKDKGLSDKRIRAMFIATFLVRLGQMQRGGRLEKARDGRGPTMHWKLADA